MQSMFRSRLAAVPLLEMLKFPCPPFPLTPPVKKRSGWLPIPPFPPFIELPVIVITSVALPAVPACPTGPPAFGFPARTWIPTPARKSTIVLFVIVARSMLAALVANPEPMRVTAEPGVATSPVSDSALFEMVAVVIVPAQFSMSIPSASGLADHVVGDRHDSGQVRSRGQAVVEGDAVFVRCVARTGDRAVREAEPVDLGSVDAAVTGVEESQVAERHAVVLVSEMP